MSRNAERDCIDAENARDDQRETARREWLESAALPDASPEQAVVDAIFDRRINLSKAIAALAKAGVA